MINMVKNRLSTYDNIQPPMSRIRYSSSENIHSTCQLLHTILFPNLIYFEEMTRISLKLLNAFSEWKLSIFRIIIFSVSLLQ